MRFAGPAVRVANAFVTMVDTAAAVTPFGTIAAVLDLDASTLHATGVAITNGTQSLGGGPCLRAANGSRVWFADATLRQNGQLACAIIDVASTVRVDRVNAGSVSGACTVGTPGLLLGVARPGPLVAGATFAIDWRTASSGFIAVFASPALDRVEIAALLEQPSWLAVAPSLLATMVLADAAGAATTSWTIPPSPTLVDQRLWFAGLSGSGPLFQASPVVGGGVR